MPEKKEKYLIELGMPTWTLDGGGYAKPIEILAGDDEEARKEARRLAGARRRLAQEVPGVRVSKIIMEEEFTEREGATKSLREQLIDKEFVEEPEKILKTLEELGPDGLKRLTRALREDNLQEVSIIFGMSPEEMEKWFSDIKKKAKKLVEKYPDLSDPTKSF